MAEHGTLAAPSGTTGVENGSQIIRLAGHHLMLITVVRSAVQQRARTVCAQRIDMAHAASESNLGHPAKAAGRAHHHRWLGIGDEVLHLSTLISGVQRQKHMATAQRGQVKHHGFNRLFHLHRNAAAFWQIERRQ